MTLSYVLLGLLARPGTGEELRAALAGELRHVWSAEPDDVDATLALLEAGGAIEGWSPEEGSEPPGAGEPRSDDTASGRIFRRTEEGTRQLLAWLASAPTAGQEGAPAAAQVRFQWELDDPEYSVHFLVQFREQLGLLLGRAQERERKLAKAFSGGPAAMDAKHLHEYLSATHGVHLLRGQLAWCDASADLLRELARNAPADPDEDSDGPIAREDAGSDLPPSR